MKKRSIAIVLALALLVLLVMAGSALAYDQKVAPSLDDQKCWMDWPPQVGGSDTYTGNYTFHLKWSLEAGRPHFYRIEHVSSYYGTTTLSPYYPLTGQQLKAGEATVARYYAMDEGEGDTWRVEVISNPGPKGLDDWTPILGQS